MSYQPPSAAETRELDPHCLERTHAANHERKILRSYPSRSAFLAGYAFIALASLGCTGIVEDPSASTSLSASASASASASVGGSASAVSSGIEPSAPTVPLPSDYRAWPVFLSGVQRMDNGQVRDLYVNQLGATVQQGQPFPEGTVLVMDLFAAQKDAAGAPVLDSGGKLIKAALLKTFVMGKDTGWGNYVSADLRNGDWLYSAYGSDGQTLTAEPLPPCFSCHLPLGSSQDWVQRYSDYFQQRVVSKD